MRLTSVLALLLITNATASKSGKIAKSSKTGQNDHSDHSNDRPDHTTSYVWTKKGLESLSHDEWPIFSSGKSTYYVTDFPFPGDEFTKDQLAKLQSISKVGNTVSAMQDLLDSKRIQLADEYAMENPGMPWDGIETVPVVYSKPIILDQSMIDYRLQYAADIGSRDLETRAKMGRLVNPAGRRLREHFYRFPDQCDATPIALEVFLRLMIYDQIEAFFHETKIGLWQDLFNDVERRQMNEEELGVARWYGERYAEGYVHQIRNGWVYPLGEHQNIDRYMLAVGLNPFNDTMDSSTPIGLGNVVGKRATEWLAEHDMLMKNNDFVDIGGLERIAAAHPNQMWNNWKPAYAGSGRFQGIRNGIVTQQTFVSPSLGIFSFLYENEDDYVSLGLQSAVPVLDMSKEAYLVRSKEFLNIQRSLTDHERAVAELSNNKISGSIFMIKAFVPLLKELASAEEYPRLYDEFSMVTSGCGEYAGVHAAWRHKRTYLAGRPKSIIQHLASIDTNFAADYPEAADFEPYIPAGDHPEYPSGSSAIYSAFVQAGDDWFLEKFGLENASSKTGTLKFTIPKDGFYWSQGPFEEVTLEYASLADWVDELPKSRIYGGVHFMEAGEAGVSLGKAVGHACTRLLTRLKAGDYNATYTYPGREAINPFNPPISV